MGLFSKSKKKASQDSSWEVAWESPAPAQAFPTPPADHSAARPRAAPSPREEAVAERPRSAREGEDSATAWLPVESTSSAVLLQALSETGIELEDDFEQGLRLRFLQFASFGRSTVASEMDSLRFVKLVNDCGIVALCPDQLPVQAIDTIFARARPKGAIKLDFGAFVVALVLVARRIQGYRAGLEEVMQCVLKTEGPPLPGSSAGDLSEQQDLPLASPGAAAREEEGLAGATALVRLASTVAEKGEDIEADEELVHEPAREEEGVRTEALLTVFQANSSIASGGEGVVDGLRFAKLCREAGLTKSMHVTHADLAFGRAAGKGRVLNFQQFCTALRLLAEALGCSELEVQRAIAAWERPKRGTPPKPIMTSGLARGLTPRGQAASKISPGARHPDRPAVVEKER